MNEREQEVAPDEEQDLDSEETLITKVPLACKFIINQRMAARRSMEPGKILCYV